MMRCFSIILLLLMALAVRGQQREKKWSITLGNRDSIDLKQKAISIKRTNLTGDDLNPLLLTAKGDTIPSQADDTDGDGHWDELFFLVDIAKGEQLEVLLKHTDGPMVYEKKTAVRFGKRDSKISPVTPRKDDTLFANRLPRGIGYQPYQTDGPSWENDKVGFRHYLDGRNSKDLFGKKVAYMSPADVGINEKGEVEDNYHVMAEWGRDIMPVNNSVGLGGIALAVRDSMYRLGVTVNDTLNNVDTTIFRIERNGPLRSVLDFQYRGWKIAGRTYQVSEYPTIWPGMYGYQNNVVLDGLKGDDTLLVGLVNIFSSRRPKEININDQWVVLFTHDRQSYKQEWWLGLGLILPYERYQGYACAPKSGPLTDSYMAELNVENGVPITYYAVAGWELADERFKRADYFEDYIVDLAKQLAAKVDVQIKPVR